MFQRILWVSFVVLFTLPTHVYAAGNYNERLGQAYFLNGLLQLSNSLKEARLAREAQQKAKETPVVQTSRPAVASPAEQPIFKCDNQELLNNFDHALAKLRETKSLKTPDENPTLVKEKFSEFLKRAIGEEAFKLLSPIEIAAMDKKWSEPVEFQQIEIMLTYGKYMNQAYAKECNHSNGRPKLGPSWYAEQTSRYIVSQSHFGKPNPESTAQVVSESAH
jgi:hypothetical protein